MNPIIDAFLNSNETISKILEKHHDPKDTVERVFLKFTIPTNLSKLSQLDYNELDEAIIKGHKDNDIYVLFISYSLIFSSNRNQIERANTIFNITKSLDLKKIHSTLQAYNHLAQAQFYWLSNNQVEAEVLTQKVFENIDKKSPRFITILGNIGTTFSQMGKLNQLSSEDLAILENQLDPIRKITFLEMKIINCIITGHAQLGNELLAQHKKLSLNFYNKEVYLVKLNSLHILNGEYQEKNFSNDAFKYLAKAYQSLEANIIFEAKKYIQLIKTNFANSLTTTLSKYLPLHLELNLKNKGQARYLLNEMSKLGDFDYFIDLFWARLYLLEKNNEMAIQFFHNLISNVLKFNAMPRLIFELKFAKELTLSDVLQLSLGHKDTKLEKPTKSIKVSTKEPTSAAGVKSLLGQSPAIQKVRSQIKKFSSLQEPILITGETGTGKELVAKAIHEESKFNKEPFIAINCGSLTDSLLESELFGYEAGSFTGALHAHAGVFEAAGDGTVFLDEFGDVSSKMQVSLLRVLELKEIRRIGGNKSIKINCKIILATNKALKDETKNKSFRKDLYFRISRFEIFLPPLVNRKEDIPVLIDHFLMKFSQTSQPQKLSTNLSNILKDYNWPGNIRELKNEIERLCIVNCDKEILDANDFKLNLDSENEMASNPLEMDSNKENLINPNQNIPTEISSIDSIIFRGSKINQRREFIKKLFEKYKQLTLRQIMEVLHISQLTAANDLKFLVEQSYIVRVTPTKSFKSHYFVLIAENT